MLYRKHHYVVDPVPVTVDGFVRDVSDFPDGTELMLAADVLLTDYSSMMFDFANTGRPMLFFTYDLERYEEEIRGFYFDFEATAPGPAARHHRRGRRGAARPRRGRGAVRRPLSRVRRHLLRARRRPGGGAGRRPALRLIRAGQQVRVPQAMQAAVTSE